MNADSQTLNKRRVDIDWLRILAVLLLVPFHSALIFNHEPQVVMYVKDATNSFFLNRFAGWIHQFHMPLLFYVSGAATYFSLQKRSSWLYTKERFLKLLIPAISGLILIIPLIIYIHQVYNGTQIDFWQCYANFWQFTPDLTGMDGHFTPAHLWFLIYLFVFSMVGLPFFMVFRKNGSEKPIKKLLDVTRVPIVIIALFTLSALSAKMNMLGDKNPIFYFVFFVTGYVFMSDRRFQQHIDKYATLILIAGIACEIARQLSYPFISSQTIILVTGVLNRWLWLLAILAFGHQFLNKSNHMLKYLSQSSYPFYLFHLLLNTIVGFYIVQIQANVAVKYSIIVILTILTTFVLYEIIRRIPVIRFLFGVKKQKT